MKRAYADTNVLIRFITGNPPEMAIPVKALFDAVERGEVDLIIDEVVLAETVWVLKSFYGFSAVDITPVLQEILRNDHIQAREKGSLLAALDFFSTKNVDFINALLAVHMEMEGILEVYSFDTHFDRFSEIKRLIPG